MKLDFTKPIDAVTVDFYNTLVFHRQGNSRGATLVHYLESRGLECDPWEHQVLYDVFEQHARDYSPDFGGEAKQDYLLRFTECVFQRLNVHVSGGAVAGHVDEIWRILGPSCLGVFSDVMPTLQTLREAGYPLSIISNWQCGLAHFCRELGISDPFDHIVTSAEIGFAKPDPRIFHHVCDCLGVPPQRALHVGDSPVDDCAGARNAGMNALLIQRGADGPSSDFPTIASLATLPDLLGIT